MANYEKPFPDLGDSDRTIIKPLPGGRRPSAARSPLSPAQADSRRATAPLPFRTGAQNPLEVAASGLLALMIQLKNTASHPDPGALYDQVIAEVKAFEARASSLGVNPETLLAARYVLCTTLDEMVLNTPWGGSTGVWSKQSLLSTFHNDTRGGERFFALLDRFKQDPANHLPMLELMYICLALGFEGRYRVMERGHSQLEEVRERLFRTIRTQRGDFERELSPHWQGVVDRRNPLMRFIPLWVIFALACALLVAVYIGFNISLNRHSDPVYLSLLDLGKGTPIAARREYIAPEPAQAFENPAEALHGFLDQPEIKDLVEVTEAGDQTIIRIVGDGLFDSGRATVRSDYLSLLEHIGKELNKVSGQVLVTGHTDDIPIRTLRFPSNLELSRERAESVMKILAANNDLPARFTAEGRAATQPLVPNNSSENRARNRRVEIILSARINNP